MDLIYPDFGDFTSFCVPGHKHLNLTCHDVY